MWKKTHFLVYLFTVFLHSDDAIASCKKTIINVAFKMVNIIYITCRCQYIVPNNLVSTEHREISDNYMFCMASN